VGVVVKGKKKKREGCPLHYPEESINFFSGEKGKVNEPQKKKRGGNNQIRRKNRYRKRGSGLRAVGEERFTKFAVGGAHVLGTMGGKKKLGGKGRIGGKSISDREGTFDSKTN